jgi:hypothetical protein
MERIAHAQAPSQNTLAKKSDEGEESMAAMQSASASPFQRESRPKSDTMSGRNSQSQIKRTKLVAMSTGFNSPDEHRFQTRPVPDTQW